MGVKVFFLRMFGKAPEQVETNRRFRERLQQTAANGDHLDNLERALESINQTAKKKTEDLRDVCTTLSQPPKAATNDGR